MQFRTTTLLLIVASVAVPLTLAAPAGKTHQAAAAAFAGLAWLGVFLAAWATDSRAAHVLASIASLTAAFTMVFSGLLGVCYCVAVGLSNLFAA